MGDDLGRFTSRDGLNETRADRASVSVITRLGL